MENGIRITFVGLALAVAPALAQEYPPVRPGVALQFPRDHGSHPRFRNEWWYITGWLRTSGGGEFGVQITFFRNRPRVAEGISSRFAPRQLLFAHAALADPEAGRLLHDQRAARAGFGLAEGAEGRTDVAIGDWSLRQTDGGYVAEIAARDFRYVLRFERRSAGTGSGSISPTAARSWRFECARKTAAAASGRAAPCGAPTAACAS